MMEFFRLLRRLILVLNQDADTKVQLRELRPIVIRTLALLLLTGILELGVVYPIKMLIDLLNAPRDATFIWGLSGIRYFYFILLVAILLYTAASIVDVRMDIARESALWKLYGIINGFGHRKVLSLSTDWHTANSSGKKESLLTKNHKKVDHLLDYFLFEILPLTLRVILIAVGCFLISWQFGLLATLTIIAYLLAAWLNEGRINPLRAEFRMYTKKIDISDAVLNTTALTIKGLGREDDFTKPHDELLEEHWAKETRRHAKFRGYIWQQDRLITVSRLTFYTISYLGSQSGMQLGTIVMANAWMEQIYSNIWRYGQFQYILNEGLSALNELVKLFETQPSLNQPTYPKWPCRKLGEITINNVSFNYPDNELAALQNIELKIEHGTTVALVGPSGSGKSTLANLLLRKYDPSCGDIEIGGIDLREYDTSRFLREMIGYVPQEPGMFDESIRFNIGITVPNATYEEIETAARRAGALEFIQELPNGFETIVGERGILLSGGQKQRIGIARALLPEPSILLLDEPTSALDAKTQRIVSNELKRLTDKRDCTVIIIAHRFSTIAAADVVVVLEQGKIIEIGTHAELERQNGLYSRLRELEGVTL